MTGKELAKILKKIKPYFEPRDGYGWDAGCELSGDLDYITGVYSYKSQLFVLTDDGNDVPFTCFSKEEQESIVKGTLEWLKKQPQTPAKYKDGEIK